MGKFDDIPVFSKFADLPETSMVSKFADQVPAEFPEFSVAWVLQWYIRAMNGWGGKRPVKSHGLGESHLCTLQRLQKAPIGKKDARKLTEEDVIEHCQMRIETVVAATINQDVGYLHGALKYVKGSPGGCKEIKAGVIPDVRKYLVTNGLIGKSTPRTRVPTDAELESLLAEFAKEPYRPNKTRIVAMPDIIAFALVSSRRVGEICSITHTDVNWDHKDEKGNPAPMYTVRNMKHPTKKDLCKTFPLFPELAVIVKRQPRKDGEDRIFPFNKKSVSAKYTRAKKALGIVNLRFHDCRREAITNWLKKFTPHQVRHYVSGHLNTVILERVYDATDPAGGHALMQSATR